MRALSFPVEEYQRRVSLVQREMTRKGLDALISQVTANICYLTGYQTIGSYGYGHYAVILEPEGDPTLFSSDFEMHNARVYAWVEDFVIYPVMAEPIEELSKWLIERGLADKRLGIETGHHSLTIAEHQRLRERLPHATLVDASEIVNRVKVIKSKAEIAMMRRAANLTSAGMLAAIDAAEAGATDNDVAAASYQTIISKGGEYFSLQPIVTASSRSGIPHTSFRRTTLRPNDTIFIEISACYERYSAPLLRTISIGAPSSDVQRAMDACLASVNTLIEHIGPGVRSCDVAQRAGKALRAIEPNLLWHGYYGYSIGLTFPPMCEDCANDVTETGEMILKPGMAFHLSTSLRGIGRFGVTVSESALVTDQGCEVLTSVPRELFVRS